MVVGNVYLVTVYVKTYSSYSYSGYTDVSLTYPTVTYVVADSREQALGYALAHLVGLGAAISSPHVAKLEIKQEPLHDARVPAGKPERPVQSTPKHRKMSLPIKKT